MDALPTYIFTLILIIGLFLLLTGILFIFFPGLLIRWNAVGNTFIGAIDRSTRDSRFVRSFFSINYTLFTRHKLTGIVLCILSVVLIFLYFMYK